MVALAALASSSLTLLRTLRQLSVGLPQSRTRMQRTDEFAAKFTGYQYGGRPLGLTFVKYAGVGDAMEGAEQTGQGDIM